MSTIKGSVGKGGKNLPPDVRSVQTLLNDNGATPRLRQDGINGKKTEGAIVTFQERTVRLRNPDGRVDPGGKTWRALNKRQGREPKRAAPSPKSPAPAERQEFRKERKSFVDPRVKETQITTRILDSLYPHFRGSNAKVISGWLSDSDLFWKVDYHWEYLKWMVEHSLTLHIDDKTKRDLNSIRSALLSVSPSPDHGYRTSATVGKPADKSSQQEMTKRHKVISQQKRAFKAITQRAALKAKSRRAHSTFHLAAAPVAHPGTSKHSTGYAIDIKGPAGTIKSNSKRLGATLVFDEKSHIHVEFKNGMSSR